MKDIYLDYSNSTPVDPRVTQAMVPYFTEQFGNPLSRHKWGAQANQAIEFSRQQVAKLINASSNEIIFTSSGSESNNMALKGAALAYSRKGKHIVISGLEHESIVFSAGMLEKMGFEITHLQFDSHGVTQPEDVRKAIRKDTIIVAVIHANSEIGTIQPIQEIGKICREHKILFFSDGISTIGNIPVDVKESNVDMMSFAGNMFYGPKGSAGLFLRQGIHLEPIIHGGRQENHHRAGTHNVSGIIGLGYAAELANNEMKHRMDYMHQLRDKLWNGLSKQIERIYLTGHPTNRLGNHLSFCVEYVEGEALLLLMELEAGVAASSGSICGEDTNQASKILLGMGINADLARGAIRFTIGKETTEQHVEQVNELMPSLVERLRQKSQIYKKLKSQKSIAS